MTAPATVAVRCLLPVVTHETGIGTICDLLRAEINSEDGDSVLLDWLNRVAMENPEVISAVNSFTDGSTMAERTASLMAMAITYRTLSAQAEVEELQRLA